MAASRVMGTGTPQWLGILSSGHLPARGGSRAELERVFATIDPEERAEVEVPIDDVNPLLEVVEKLGALLAGEALASRPRRNTFPGGIASTLAGHLVSAGCPL